MLGYQPQLISYDHDGKHYLRGHLLSTKKNKNGWSVSKDTIHDNIQNFKGFPFIVSLKKDDPREHFIVSNEYNEQMEKQKVVTRGKITDIFGPFSYNDGTDDVYYDSEVEIEDKPISNALVAGTLPFMTSAFIWEVDGNGKPLPLDQIVPREGIRNWIPAHQALVTDGAYGFEAVVSKQCVGEQGMCHNALAASSETVGQFLSSQLYIERLEDHKMDNPTNVNDTPVPEQRTEVPESKAPIQTQEAPKVEVTAEAFEKLKAEYEKTAKNYNKLLTKDQTRELESIFGEFPDEESKNKILKKWVDNDEVSIETLKEFYNDISEIIINPLKEKATKKGNPLAASTEKKDETQFPLAASTEKSGRLHRPKSLTQILGGTIK